MSVDIQKSHEIAQDIVNQARQGEVLEGKVNDATSKVGLLNGELAFNKSLGATLERIQAVQRNLDLIQEAIWAGQLLESVDLIGQVEEGLKSISVPRSTRLAGVLGARVADLRNDVVEKLTDCWKAYVCVDSAKSSIKISFIANGMSPEALSDDPRLITFQALLQ